MLGRFGSEQIRCQKWFSFLFKFLLRRQLLLVLTQLQERAATGAGVARFQPGDFQVTERKFEVADLCEKLLGHPFKVAYTFILGFYMYGLMWAYLSVFGTSFAGQVRVNVQGPYEAEDAAIPVIITYSSMLCIPVSSLYARALIVSSTPRLAYLFNRVTRGTAVTVTVFPFICKYAA